MYMSVFNVLFAPRKAASAPSTMADFELVMQKMIAASDYWNPEQCAMEKAERSQSDLLVSHLLFNNTPQSLFETVHKSPCGNYFCVANARLDNRDELLHELAISSADDLADGALIL